MNMSTVLLGFSESCSCHCDCPVSTKKIFHIIFQIPKPHHCLYLQNFHPFKKFFNCLSKHCKFSLSLSHILFDNPVNFTQSLTPILLKNNIDFLVPPHNVIAIGFHISFLLVQITRIQTLLTNLVGAEFYVPC